MSYELVLRGATLMTPSGPREADVGVSGGKIAEIGTIAPEAGGETIHLGGAHVLPGLIDSQVHFREPGLEHKEDLATGTAGAALGGITAIFEMPNTKPNTDTAERLSDKVQRGRDKAFVDFAFFIGATAENAEVLGELERLEGCSGVKIFMGSSTGSLLVADDPTLERVLSSGSRRVAVHCEDEDRLIARRSLAEEGAAPRFHPVWRDVESARLATERLLRVAARTGRRVHVLHVTTEEEVELLSRHKAVATMEVTPQHLTLEEDAYARLGTKAQMNPPIRGGRHRAALWRAVQKGIADVVGSDHAPHTLEEKARPYPQSPSGMPGVQTTVPLLLDAVAGGKLSLTRLVDLLAHGPCRIFGIAEKGRLGVGYDADFTIVDLKGETAITDASMATRTGWTPFHGMTTRGRVLRTIVRGQTVMADGELLPRISAQPVRFQECLPR
ncbi:MAG: dihydroorotase [Myxococcota bacterium]